MKLSAMVNGPGIAWTPYDRETFQLGSCIEHYGDLEHLGPGHTKKASR